LSSPVRWRGTNRILLASALSSMRIICPNSVSRHDWIIAVSLGCFVSLRTSSFHTNWYDLMPSSIRRHHWWSTSILHASVFDNAQQSEPYRNIGKMHVLYSFNFIEVASRDLRIWFSRLCMAAGTVNLCIRGVNYISDGLATEFYAEILCYVTSCLQYKIKLHCK